MRIVSRWYFLWLLLAGGCRDSTAHDGTLDPQVYVGGDLRDAASEQDAAGEQDAASEAATGGDGDGGPPGPDALPVCDPSSISLPKTLECTGLYADIGRKVVAKAVRSFAPAVPLWSDGAEKQRWIYLPPGEKIDNSDPNQWKFPVGTRTWKEFTVDGKRVETRLFWKVAENKWEKVAYIWNDAEDSAESSFGAELDHVEVGDGLEYHVPTKQECDRCHDGQGDHVLGFSQVLLGLPGAEDVSLGDLVDEGLLTNPPDEVELEIGSDATGVDEAGVSFAARALGALHVNCGISCHNDNPRRDPTLTWQLLRLDATQLDGSGPDSSWDIISTTVNVEAEVTQSAVRHRTRIIPGVPENSLIIQLMRGREASGGNSQMPPIATQVVDVAAVDAVSAWIDRL